jgi:Mn2+/Fe2+ NRAMP family transporter
MNLFGVNPMKALVWSGIVQGFSTPPLMLLIMSMTNHRAVVGDKVNGRGINVLGYATVVILFAATLLCSSCARGRWCKDHSFGLNSQRPLASLQ